MNAAKRLLTNIGAFRPLCNFRDYRLITITGTPPRKRWGKDRSYRAITVTPARQLDYMHSHARRRHELQHFMEGLRNMVMTDHWEH